jgi:hypothetical protein
MAKIILEEQAAPSTPAANKVVVYPKTGGGLYKKDDTGTELELGFPVVDTAAIVKGSTDATKLVRIEADGLTASTTRVLTMPDKDLTPAEAGVNADITSMTGLDNDGIPGAKVVAATTTTEGVSERATDAEAIAGADDARHITPANLTAVFNRTDNLIGVAGTAGFGVGICPAQSLPDGMTPLSGYDQPVNENYGNYQYRDGSIMCWIPRFYYKISTLTTDIKGIDTYATETLANAAGYAMHRAFIDGGTDQQGFFYDKYKCSKNAWGTGQIASSLPYGLPISTASAHNQISDLTACAGNYYYEVINASHGRDGVDGAVNSSSIFHVTTMFQHGAIALLSLAHGQAASNTTNCAWYDATYNCPKGCNNDALKDYDEVTNGAGSGDDLLYISDGYSNCGKTGSGIPFAKSTHNGQACGVADVNGLMYEINLGLVRSGTTDSENINDGLGTTKFYVLKESVSAKDLTSGWTTGAGVAGSTAWGDAAYLEGATTSYDLLDLPMIGQATGSVYFGNSTNQVLDAATSGAGWLRTGSGIYLDAGSSATGTNLFGKESMRGLLWGLGQRFWCWGLECSFE